MKKIDRLFIQNFIGPFILTTAIVVFILLMRVLMLYLDTFVGKDLGFETFGKIFLYFSLISVPTALPLAVLLATLMCFGNMGEHTELTALKSAGISLNRLILPTLVFTGLISLGSYFYNNKVSPWANLKGFSLLYDVKTAKMTLNIQPGVFYKEIPGYRIKVQEKGKDGKTLKNVLIYDHNSNNGNKNMILADSGKMYFKYNNNYLIFELYNGKNYVEGGMGNSNNDTQLTKTAFKKDLLVFSMKSFGVKRTDEDQFKYHEFMKDSHQLSQTVDSTKKSIKMILENQNKMYKAQKSNIFGFKNQSVPKIAKNSVKILPGKWVNEKINKLQGYENKILVFENALNDIKNQKSVIETDMVTIDAKQKEIWRADLEWWHKITSAFSCIVMFFIGAAIGSIIKKGGFGMPVLVSISFFIIMYVLMQMGDKYAKEGLISVFFGAWLPNFVLLFVAAYLMKKAVNDESLLENNRMGILLEKIKNRFTKTA